MKKKIKISALILAVTAIFTACGKTGEYKEISMYDLSKAMTSAGSLEDMAYASSEDSNAEELLSNVAETDYSKIDSFFISYAQDGSISADEIVVIRVKDTAYLTQVRDMLKKHVDYRISLYSTYGPKEVPKLNNADVFTKDSFAVLIVADNTKEIHSAFDNFTA
ncbi:MAG: DUF4358 domain-containing protein [Clostridia bacterium]|nr:DUF4358 domain-containing protein [Clostridia bacterium]